LDLYSASDYLPTALTDPVKGPSYRVEETAFQLAVGTDLPRWSWLEERIPKTEKKVNSHGYPRANGSAVDGSAINGNGTFDKDDGQPETVPRPELEIFGLAMLGGGRVFGTAHLYDYPWEDLADGTVVDVGGGVGEFITIKHPATSGSKWLTRSPLNKAVSIFNYPSCIPACSSWCKIAGL
jgi:hypothetical protein